MAEFTPWFDSEEKPVREGYYDVRTGSGKELRGYFGTVGRRTGWWVAPPAEGLLPYSIPDVLEWRGLASPN